MDETAAARLLLQRALEDMRLMSRRPDLCSDNARRTMFAIADAVHNLVDVLVPGSGVTLESRLHRDDPRAQEWVSAQLASFASGVPVAAPGEVLRWKRADICPHVPDPYAERPDLRPVLPMS
jgi:hypothetical protein